MVRWDIPKVMSGFSFLTESRFSYSNVSNRLGRSDRRDGRDGSVITCAKNM